MISNSRKIAFFDLDGTLIKEPSSESRFIWYLIKKRYVHFFHFFAAIKFTILNFHRYKSLVFKKNKAYLLGLSVEKIQDLAKSFVEERLIYCCRESMLTCLRGHQEKRDITVLLTGAPHFIADPLAKSLGFDHCIAATYQELDGRFCAAVPTIHPLGKEKLILAEQFCSLFKTNLKQAVAYADSIYDIALLSEVGTAVLVAPAAKLKVLGFKKEWRMIE